MRVGSSKLSETPPDTQDGLSRLETIYNAQAQPDVYIEKWPRALRLAFIIGAGIVSWSAIILFLSMIV